VKGLVANLITLPDAQFPKATALEVAAGGRLYNVVVDDERVGGQLLQGGQLKKRVTLIPLNKIKPFMASAQVGPIPFIRFRQILTLRSAIRNSQLLRRLEITRPNSRCNSLDMKKKCRMLWHTFSATC
jgi:chromosome segregation ATPase